MKDEKIIKLATKNYEKFQNLLDHLACGYKITGQFKYFFLNDLVDLMNFYCILMDGDYKRAFNKFNDIDTDLRETIPLVIENFLIDKCEK